jgi:hypothetical protein
MREDAYPPGIRRGCGLPQGAAFAKRPPRPAVPIHGAPDSQPASARGRPRLRPNPPNPFVRAPFPWVGLM